ncbi:MAG: PIG-L family deacetylase [Nitrospira sp. CG24C]|jgi:LmbE family N-acetylglucosaminyl deacetylase|nr:MAG: PIG-L family deacetylase [Nitrospira sp. CG24C]
MSHNHVVIISAHPDDMEIGMGGMVAKLAESMAVISSIVVTNGGRSSNPFAFTEQRMAEVRREEALRAAGVLGVKDVIFFDEPDAVEEINTASVAGRLVEILTRLQPTEVYTLDEELDRHPAHRLAGKLARESVLKSGIVLSGGLWAYEIWGPFAIWDRLEYIDRYVAKKMAAIAEHHSQVATIPYGEGVLGLNRWRAVFAHPKASAPAGQYAEAFRRITISPVLK